MVSLSTSAFNCYSQCPKRYEYQHVDHLVPVPRNVRPVIRRGIWIHAALEEYHKGNQWGLVLGKMSHWAEQHGVPEDQLNTIYREVDDIMQGYIAYWEKYGTPYKTIATEKKLEWTTKSGDVLSATLDMLAEDRDGLWIWEHKSTSEIPPASWRAIDPQTMIQVMVAIANGLNVVGVRFNYLWTKPPSRPRVKKNGEFYANAEGTKTTSIVWDEIAVEHATLARQAGWDGERIQAYQAEWRDKLVNDGAFYQRYDVYRSPANIRETAKDLQTVLRELKASLETGSFRRAFHVTGCRRFCSYSDLCVLEYVRGGKVEEVRSLDYVVETPEIRSEGRV